MSPVARATRRAVVDNRVDVRFSALSRDVIPSRDRRKRSLLCPVNNPLPRPSSPDRRCHRDLVIFSPGRPNGPPQLDEACIEAVRTLSSRRTSGLPNRAPVAAPASALRYITQSATFCAR